MRLKSTELPPIFMHEHKEINSMDPWKALAEATQNCLEYFDESVHTAFSRTDTSMSELQEFLRHRNPKLSSALDPIFDYLDRQDSLRLAIPNYWIHRLQCYVIQSAEARVGEASNLSDAVDWLRVRADAGHTSGSPPIQLLTQLIAASEKRHILCIVDGDLPPLAETPIKVTLQLSGVTDGYEWRGAHTLAAELNKIHDASGSKIESLARTIRTEFGSVFSPENVLHNGLGLLNNFIVLRLAERTWRYLWYFPSQVPGADAVGGWLILTREALSDEEITLFSTSATIFFQDIASGLAQAEAKRAEQAERQLAKKAVYSEVLRELLHEEGEHSRELDSFIKNVKGFITESGDLNLIEQSKRLSFFALDKQGLFYELRNGRDPMGHVPPEILYPSEQYPLPQGNLDISIAEIEDYWEVIQQIVRSNTNKLLNSNLRIGEGLRAIGKIENLDDRVFRRIIFNLTKNTARIARERDILSPELEVYLDIIELANHSFLQITTQDNCGGFEETFPSTITVETWSDYRTANSLSRGVGFLFISRYTEASGGTFKVRNVEFRDSAGAQIELRLKLLTKYLCEG